MPTKFLNSFKSYLISDDTDEVKAPEIPEGRMDTDDCS